MNRIITISREFGSGGREIGRRLAEKMKIAYYDQEVIGALIQRSPEAERYIRYVSKERPLPLLPISTARTFGMSANCAAEQNLKFYLQESQVIREMAEKSDCIIVGRCGDFVLRHMEPLRLFVYAEMESKIARCRRKGEDVQGMSDKELIQEIRSVDKKRARYYKFFINQTWGKKENYDLCLNTSRITDLKEFVSGLEKLILKYGKRP